MTEHKELKSEEESLDEFQKDLYEHTAVESEVPEMNYDIFGVGKLLHV